MRKLLSAMVVVFSMGAIGTVFAQDFEKGLKAHREKDYQTALKEWRYLADRGDAEAQSWIGIMYDLGNGVLRDKKEAMVWYRKAADQGHVGAQTWIGRMYYFGVSVIQDYKESLLWFRKAAEQGGEAAQFAMAVSYEYGRGVIQDDVYAHMWYNIAASNDAKDGLKYRDEIANKMTATDISKAQDLARECERKRYKGC